MPKREEQGGYSSDIFRCGLPQGYGTFNAIDYAIALDVVQDGADAAKDLGLWNLSLVRPV